MNVLGRSALLLFSMASVGPGQQPTSAAECDAARIVSPTGIGPLRIGMSVDSLSRMCPILGTVRDAGTIEHSVRLGGDTVTFIEQGGRVSWIGTRSPVHRTRDSLGVGSAVERLLDLPDIAGTGFAGDQFVVYPLSGEHCGLSFWLDPRAAEAVRQVGGDVRRALGMRGAGGVVASIEIRGACPAKKP